MYMTPPAVFHFFKHFILQCFITVKIISSFQVKWNLLVYGYLHILSAKERKNESLVYIRSQQILTESDNAKRGGIGDRNIQQNFFDPLAGILVTFTLKIDAKFKRKRLENRMSGWMNAWYRDKKVIDVIDLLVVL